MYKRVRKPPVEVPLLLDRLGIRAKRIARTKWAAPCPNPNHDDRNPSWMIREDPGNDFHASHVCKSCGFQGGPASLVAGVLGVSIEEAREWLDENARGAAKVPVRVEVEREQRKVVREFRLPEVAQPITRVGLDYLASRGVPEWQAIRYGILEVPDDARDPERKSKRHLLAGRVLIPFRDLDARVVSYTARAWGKHPKRYLEPTKADGASDSAILGEEYWENKRCVVVCEGAFDALAAERALGFDYAVAAIRGASNAREAQCLKLLRFEHVLVATDPDPAGEMAWRQLRAQLSSSCKLARVQIPVGTDLGKLGETDAARELLEPAARAILGIDARC